MNTIDNYQTALIILYGVVDEYIRINTPIPKTSNKCIVLKNVIGMKGLIDRFLADRPPEISPQDRNVQELIELNERLAQFIERLKKGV